VQGFVGETEGLRLLGRGEMYTGICWGETEGVRLLRRGEMYTGFCWGDWGNETTGER